MYLWYCELNPRWICVVLLTHLNPSKYWLWTPFSHLQTCWNKLSPILYCPHKGQHLISTVWIIFERTAYQYPQYSNSIWLKYNIGNSLVSVLTSSMNRSLGFLKTTVDWTKAKYDYTKTVQFVPSHGSNTSLITIAR